MARNRQVKKMFFRERTSAITAVFFILGALVLARLFYLQIIRHSGYSEAADDQHQVNQEILQSRGEIYAQDYKNNSLAPLVINREMGMLYIVPKEILEKEKTARALAELLETDREERKTVETEILAKAKKFGDPYEPIRHKIEPELVARIKGLKLAGVYFSNELIRYYPEKESAGQLTGFLGFNNNRQVGQYGLEGYFEKELAGEKGSILADKDLLGRLIPASEKKLKAAKNGADIILTIDRIVQSKAYEFIKDAVEANAAGSGTIIVMEPKSGRVEALANYPNFDPNNYGEVEDPKVYRNLAVSEPYEPGSIFKIITMAAGLDSGAIAPEDTFTDTGEIKIGAEVIRNADNKKYGKITMTGILENSVNNGAVFIALKTGKDIFQKYVKSFGFGELTGVELMGEAKGDIGALNEKGNIYLATASFGQGITVTPMQMIAALATIVNDGQLVRPKLVDYVRKENQEIKKNELASAQRIISEKTAKIVKAMMVSVVKNGHTKSAQIAGYNIGGKTGTAEIASKGGGGYSNETNHSFVGFGPLENTRFVILVKLTKPQKGIFAESTAVPVFVKMANFLLQYYQVAPEE